MWKSEQEELYGWPGEVRKFHCKAAGVPKPDMTWLRMSNFLENDDIYTIKGKRGSSELIVSLQTNLFYIFKLNLEVTWPKLLVIPISLQTSLKKNMKIQVKPL